MKRRTASSLLSPLTWLKLKPIVVFVLVLAGIMAGGIQAAGPGDHFQRIDLRSIRVGGEMGRRIDAAADNVLRLDQEKLFLRRLREPTATGGYAAVGKWLDSAVRLAAYTENPELARWKETLVSGILAAQGPDGYVGLMKPEARILGVWDVHECAYLIYGLTSDYEFFGNKESLDGARRLADYIIENWSSHPDWKPGEPQLTVHMTTTGLDRALLRLADVTGESRYRDFIVEFRELYDWDMPIVVGRHGQIKGHIYAYLAHALAQLEQYRRDRDPRLLRTTRRALEFLTVGDGLVVIGTCGDHECWHDSQAGTCNLGETCATAYLIRWLGSLLRMTGEPYYGDVMERSVYNALFAAQSPDGSQIRYYSPMTGPRQYHPRPDYCCPGNFQRIIAGLPQMLFYRADDGVVVNLYAPAEATVELPEAGAVKLTQRTDYPNSARVTLRVEPENPAEFAIRLRIPAWCQDARTQVNDEPEQKGLSPGEFALIRRTWRAGDVVTLDLPMDWRLVRGRQAQSGRVAVMRGPMVFCLNPAHNKATGEMNTRLIVLDPDSLEGPSIANGFRPDAMSATAKAWRPETWYPFAEASLELTLTEFADPGGRLTYFFVPNPKAASFVDDELMRRPPMP